MEQNWARVSNVNLQHFFQYIFLQIKKKLTSHKQIVNKIHFSIILIIYIFPARTEKLEFKALILLQD